MAGLWGRGLFKIVVNLKNFQIFYFGIKRNTVREQSTNGPKYLLSQKIKNKEIEVDVHQQKVVEKLQKVYEEVKTYKITKQKPPKGLYIHGSVGTGKTMLMDLFYNSCVEIREKRRIHFNEFMLDVHQRIHRAKTNNKMLRDPIDPVAKELTKIAWLLCFDEFQVIDIADAMIIKILFTKLFENGVVVIATSNRQPDDLYKNGLQRSNFVPFIPVLKNYCEIVSLNTGKDYRTIVNKRETQEQRYFVGGSADVEMDKVFKNLCSEQTDTQRPRTIEILGRQLTFNKTCGRILDTKFYDLCGRALGSVDYVYITQIFNTILIRNVPKLNLNNRNETRRFILLVDTMYDTKTRLVMSAVVTLDKLFSSEGSQQPSIDRALMDDLKITANSDDAAANVFTGHEELFAFQRTVSRLTEMQTNGYWNAWAGKN